MKIQRFNEAMAPPAPPPSFSGRNSGPYIKCKFKNRTPDPGMCYVTEIDFEKRKVWWSNGAVRSTASFDDIEFIPDIFIFNKYNL